MNKPQIRIADTQFAHGTSLGSGDLKVYPKYFDWYRGPEQIGDMIVITESCFDQIDTFKEFYKIALIVEPVSINGWAYEFVRNNLHLFNYVLTHNRDFIAEINNKSGKTKAVFYFFGGCWLEPADWVPADFKKTKGVSIIASGKREAPGHKLRHTAIEHCRESIDGIFGRGYQPVEFKIEALRDYQYTIVIENEKTDWWITEKLIDAFMARCIPVYWGCPSIADYFNTDGMILFDNVDQLKSILSTISGHNKIDGTLHHIVTRAIEQNFRKAQAFTVPENYMWLNFFSTTFKFEE